jgi:adenosine deaminase
LRADVPPTVTLAVPHSVVCVDRRRLEAIPKIDLHRHLEGSLRLGTLVDIAAEHGMRLPSHDLTSLRPLVQFVDRPADFRSFLARFEVLRQFYSTEAAIRRIAREAVLDAAADGLRYLELRLSPLSLAESQRFSLDRVLDWVVAGVADGQKADGITVRLILTIVRGCEPKQAERIFDLARAYRSAGVVGIDLAGDELTYPAQPYATVFRRARDLGLGTTVHAGEVTHAESIRTAVETLAAQRIGHGVHARDDATVVDLLRQQGVTLEMCPTSNLQTGAVVGLSSHPLPEYLRGGVRVTVNTDNPSVSCTTLTDEYQIVANELLVTWPELIELILNAVRAAFLPDDEKKELETWFRRILTSSSPVASAAANPRSP